MSSESTESHLWLIHKMTYHGNFSLKLPAL